MDREKTVKFNVPQKSTRKKLFCPTNFSSRIDAIQFGINSPYEIEKMSALEVTSKELYMVDPDKKKKKPVTCGVLDPRLGINQKNATCETCNRNINDCIGHFGYIDLQLPVFHAGYFRNVIEILQTICKNPNCGRVLLNADIMIQYHRRLRNPNITYVMKKSIRTQIRDKAKKCSKCPHCGYVNGLVKKSGMLKISHEKYRYKKHQALVQQKLNKLQNAVDFNSEIAQYRKFFAIENLNPLDVSTLFEAIPVCDHSLLLMSPGRSAPKDLILTRIPVPPLSIRPSVISDIKSGTNEDDLTMKISEILFINDIISNHRQSGARIQMLCEDWEYLQLHCAMYINSEMSGFPLNMKDNKAIRGLVQRLKGKRGRFRGNLSGKRTDFTARTVISPDPYLEIGQVGVPEYVAQILTYPQPVFPANLKLMKKLVENGSENYPGANFVNPKGSQFKRSLRYSMNREKMSRELKVGDVVERHLKDGDIVLFNRQPSLHKLSIMCFIVKVMKHKTFKFNECNCTPFNADFDGDEMNIHFPQTEEARAEALVLMKNTSNLLTSKSGEILIAATQDFITGTYLLTMKDTFFDEGEMSRLVGWLCANPKDVIDLPPPAILKPRVLWTGKQVMSALLKPTKNHAIKLNFKEKGRSYTRDEEMCYKDSFIVIRNSELLAGTLDKNIVGSGGKRSIFYALYRDWGKDVTCSVMLKLCRIASFYLMNRGFSFGIGDVTAGEDLLHLKDGFLKEGYAKCENFIKDMKEGNLQCHPGLDEAETLEAMILKELSAIREHAGKACMTQLKPSNSALIMALCGSKGSVINLSQMIACVGQQAIGGKRVVNGFGHRSLPHFDEFCQHPSSRGFCHNSFYTGLTPTEFYFHTMAGREGLIDTAVKTAETGYMQRRLVKGLEDVKICYDMTVRNCQNDMIQFRYGDDSIDPTFMEGDGNHLINFTHVYNNISALNVATDEPALNANEIKEETEKRLKSDEFSDCSSVFIDDVRQFCDDVSKKVENALDAAYCETLGIRSSVVTKSIHSLFLDTCRNKYTRSIVEPGTAIGCLAAQSIGEPGTQMTLKTFHFAGVASMNITQGVPRIKEIINCAKTLSTPVITVHLANDTDEDFARRVRARIESTTLSEITDYMENYVTKDDGYLIIKINLERIKVLLLGIDVHAIARKICSIPRGSIRVDQIRVHRDDIIIVSSTGKTANVSKELRNYREICKRVVIQGYSTVKRAFVHEDQKKGVTHYKILAESEDLLRLMSTYGVLGTRCLSNSIYGVFKALGIEAARETIISEIKAVMENHGMTVDYRHLMLLADLMTYKGEPLGVTRYGLAKMKESVLNLASFEKTADHLFEAAYHGQIDKINGVSECIITGTPIPLGTGSFKVLYKQEDATLPPIRTLLFSDPEFHTTTLSANLNIGF